MIQLDLQERARRLKEVTSTVAIIELEHGHEVPAATKDAFRRYADGALTFEQLQGELDAISEALAAKVRRLDGERREAP